MDDEDEQEVTLYPRKASPWMAAAVLLECVGEVVTAVGSAIDALGMICLAHVLHAEERSVVHEQMARELEALTEES